MKQNCNLLQIYLRRIRFKERVPKIPFNISTICIDYQLKTLRESLTRVTNDFLGDFGLLLLQFDLYWFQTLMVNGRDLVLEVWSDPKIQRIQIEEWWGCGPLSESQSWCFCPPVMVWTGVTESEKSPLFFVDQGMILNQQNYREYPCWCIVVLSTSAFKNRLWSFQQDSAPSHEAKKTQEWLSENVPHFITKEEWAPSSPDLNPLDFGI